MTLLKKEVDNQPEFDPAEAIKMEKFTRDIIEIATYLGQFHKYDANIANVHDYNYWLIHRSGSGHLKLIFLCVAGNKGKSENLYLKTVIENIFPYPYSTQFTSYNCICHADWSGIRFWRDDIHFPPEKDRPQFIFTLKQLLYPTPQDDCERYLTCYFSDNRKEYNVFWNLFLCAIDDDVYNEQLPNVVELAHYLNFDEPMIRDWCRAVEYVLAGNKLSENCDLECETVEGARFFLHKNEEDLK